MTRDEIQKLVEAGDVDALVKAHSEAMKTVEMIWFLVGRSMGEKTEAGKALSMYHRAKTFHCDADVLANEMASVPMPKSGER